MLYIAFVCIFLSIFLFTYNKNHLSKKRSKIMIMQVRTCHITTYTRAGDWVGYPIYYCKTQSLGGSFTMHDPNLWAQLNYASTRVRTQS